MHSEPGEGQPSIPGLERAGDRGGQQAPTTYKGVGVEVTDFSWAEL